MCKFFVKLLCIVAVFAGCSNHSVQKLDYNTNAISLGYSSQDIAAIDSFLLKKIDSGISSNATCLIVQHGKVIYNKAFGVKDLVSKDSSETNDLYPLISLTKPIITVAFLQLCEKGLVSLDTPISSIFPEFSNEKLVSINEDGTYTTKPVDTPATFMHLLTHTSGFGSADIIKLRMMKQGLNGMEVMQPLQNGQHTGGSRPEIKYLSENMDELLCYPLAFEPGTKWSYHEGLNLAGYAIERITGQPLREYVKQNILEPLGMTDTDWYYDEEDYKRISKVCVTGESGLTIGGEAFAFNICGSNRTYCEGATGLNSSVEDYAKFAQMLLNRGEYNNHKILTPESVELMTSKSLVADGIIDEFDGLPARFALGFRVYDETNKPYDKISNSAFSWSGMTGCKLLVDPQYDAIFLVFNSVLMFDNKKFNNEFLPYAYNLICTK